MALSMRLEDDNICHNIIHCTLYCKTTTQAIANAKLSAESSLAKEKRERYYLHSHALSIKSETRDTFHSDKVDTGINCVAP